MADYRCSICGVDSELHRANPCQGGTWVPWDDTIHNGTANCACLACCKRADEIERWEWEEAQAEANRIEHIQSFYYDPKRADTFCAICATVTDWCQALNP